MQMTNSKPICQVYLADEPHYLVDDVAELLGVTRRTVIRWMDDPEVKLHRIRYDSRSVCVPAEDVHQLLAELSVKDGDRPGGAPPPRPKPSDGPPRSDSQ